MLSFRLAILSMGAGLTACEPSNLRDKAQSASHEVQSSSVPEDERVDPPNNISGAFLHCAIEVEPTDSKPEALVGCRMDDSSGKRVSTASLATSFSYTYKAQTDSSIQVYVKQLNGDARYDAAYLFFGPNRQALLTAVQKTTVFVQLTNAKSTGTNALVGDQIGDISRDKNTIPEAANSNYNNVRDEILVDAQQGQVTPPLP